MTLVTLSCEALGERQFTIDHAERLLSYQAHYKLTDWKLSDPNFTFKNGIIKLANTRTVKEPKA